MKGRVFEIREFCLHDGPGIRTTVFLKGCPLRCVWCHNPEGQSFERETMVRKNGERVVAGEDWEADALAEELLRNADIMAQSGGGVTFSGGEPLAQADFTVAVAERLRAAGTHCAIETSGHAPEETYRRVVSRMDFVYQDLKHHDAAAFRRWCGGDLGLVLANLAWLRENGIPFAVRVPVVPGVNDSAEDRKALLALVGSAPTMRGVEFLPYNPAAPAKYAMLGRKYLLTPSGMDAAREVCRIVRDAGGRGLLVGGAVRDLLLGESPKDLDIEVFGIAPQALTALLGERFALDLVGASFGVIKLKGLDIDVSIPRRESKSGLGHKAFEVMSDPSLSVAEAALRRDFTINAIYFDPLGETFDDPYGGADDLKRGTLRHVSEKFSEDPLRVLRGMQFIARFGLNAAPETVALCRTIDPEGLPPERIFGEWQKLLLKGKAISSGLRFLRATGWVRHYPELAALIGCEQDSEWHPEGDVWNHTLKCLDAFARERIGDEREDLTVGLAVLCHDFGKPATTRFEDGRIRSRGHDEAGVAPTLAFLRRMTAEQRILDEVPPLVKAHMAPVSLWRSNAGDPAIRRLAAKVVRIDRLVRVARADALGSAGGDQGVVLQQDALDWLSAAAERLRIADAAPVPILRGRDLIALGLEPSPKFGEILSKAYEAQLDGVFCDEASAKDWLRSNIE